MSSHDKSKLNERLRDKPGDEFINEIKKEFENNKKSWFNNSDTPNFRSLKRNVGENFGKNSDAGIKSHLEDLAKKHPEFANNLKCPPWGGSANKMDKNWENAFTIPVSVEKNIANNEQSASQSNLNKENDTVDFQATQQHNSQEQVFNNLDKNNQDQNVNKILTEVPGDQEEKHKDIHKPDAKRFTSKIEITPVNPYAENNISSDCNDQIIEKNNTTSNVRHIPVIPITSSNNNNSNSTYASCNQSHEIPVNQQCKTEQFSQPLNTNNKVPQVRHIPIFIEGRSSFSDPNSKENSKSQDLISSEKKINTNVINNKSSPPVSESQTQQELDSKKNSTEFISTESKSKDVLQCIQSIQNEIEMLTKKIEEYSGNSRSDKEYLYLDEMLTRNLIKLDNIEVEGNDELRSFRKNVIRSIQKSISLLESKVPVVNEVDTTAENNDVGGLVDKVTDSAEELVPSTVDKIETNNVQQ